MAIEGKQRGIRGGQKISRLFNDPSINGETAKYLNIVQNKIRQHISSDRTRDVIIAKQMQDFLNVLKKQGTESEKMNVINLMEEKALN